MSTRILVNGAPSGQVSALDRGMAYGDGLFESIRFVSSVAPLWSRHMQRLAESCRRLQMTLPDQAQLWSEAQQVCRGLPHCVVRITITRGAGERGYAFLRSTQATRIVAAFPSPQPDPVGYARGVRLRICTLQLAHQPLLAGMKHLNRLEQVLARAEWDDPAIAEGILLDSQGTVISATMANLFLVTGGTLCTPSLEGCGVAGVARAEVLDRYPQTQVGPVTVDTLLGADEVFLSSSVRGIVPVCRLADQFYAPGRLTRCLQQHWHTLGFSMEQNG